MGFLCLAAMEADPAIEQAVKDLLRPKYRQAIVALKEAADFATKLADSTRTRMFHPPAAVA